MRVAYLLKKFPRLSETFILGELLAQEELRGEPIRVYSRRAPDDEPRHPQLADHRGEVEVLPSTRHIDPWKVLFARTPDGDRSHRLLAAIRRVVEQYADFAPEKLPSLVAEALYLLDKTREDGVEHLHVHFATESAITAMILRALGGPSYSITAHAKDIYRDTVDPAKLDALVAHSDFTVTVCDANVAHMRSLVGEVAKGRIRRHYNGIDLTDFKADEVPEARAGHRILAVGRLVEKKGFDVLLDACKLLRERDVAFTCDLLGQGDQEAELRAHCTELGLDDLVTFHGPQDQGVVRAAMADARVFALPCIIGDDGNRDALPTVLIEAIASGLPCVSTPVTGIPEILTHGAEAAGPAGTIVPERDAAATADALEELLADDAKWLAFARAAPARAAELFDRRKQGVVLAEWLDATSGVPA